MRKMMMIALMALVGVMAYAEGKSDEFNTAGRRMVITYNDEWTLNKSGSTELISRWAIESVSHGAEIYEPLRRWNSSNFRTLTYQSELSLIVAYSNIYHTFYVNIEDDDYIYEFIITYAYAYTNENGVRFHDWYVYTLRYPRE